jgi:hypothetical protein
MPMNPIAFFETIGHLPVVLMSVIGLIVLFFYWKRMGVAAVMVLVALIANLIGYVVNLLVANWFHAQILQGATSISELSQIRGLLSIPLIVLSTSAWGLLIGAVFVGRGDTDESIRHV